MLLLSRECHLVPAATGTSDILIFSRKNKKERKRKKVYECNQVREMQFSRSFSFPLSLLHAQRQHCHHSICSSIRLFRTPSKCTVSKVQGKYNIVDRYSRDPLIHCLDGGDTRRRWRSPGGVRRRDASTKRRILIWRMRKFQEDLLPRNFPQRHATKSVKGGKRRPVTICKKKKNIRCRHSSQTNDRGRRRKASPRSKRESRKKNCIRVSRVMIFQDVLHFSGGFTQRVD